MPEFSSSKIIEHRFHVDNFKGNDMIIGRDLMVKIGLTVNLKRQFPQWDGVTLSMKEPSGLLGQSYLTSREMRVVVMQTVEQASTREATEILLKILDMPMRRRALNR